MRDTIDLKQNNASIYEAHSSRKETEAIMVFTLVSSFIVSSLRFADDPFEAHY